MSTCIGLDIGYGYTKAVTGNGHQTTFPSVLGPAVDVKYDSDLSSNGHDLEIRYDHQTWFVGQHANLQSPFTLSPRARERDPAILRLLTFGALHRLDVTAGPLGLMTGLPVAWYPDREALIQTLTGVHNVVINGETTEFEITQVAVVPQPFGSLFRVLLNPAGVLIDTEDLSEARVGIIDIGTHTTDYALVDGLRYVEPKSGSIPVAMARVYELVQRAVVQRHDLDLSPTDTEAAIRRGYVQVYDQQQDVEDIVAEASGIVAQEILGEAATLWGSGRDLATVLVTGGGGIALLEKVKLKYPHARLLCEPQTANAEGFYRYALRKFPRSA